MDIGKLEMALMRNVPPTPANYAQRAGRAGRRHRIAVVFAYCAGSQHDRYFFANPPEMITGRIRVPAFSMRNAPLVRKHVHSATLTILRRMADPQVSETLGEALPAYIWRYFGLAFEQDGRARFQYLSSPPDFTPVKSLVRQNSAGICAELRELLAATWPTEDAEAVSEQALGTYVREMPERLDAHVRNLFRQVQAYRAQIKKISAAEADSDVELGKAEERERNRYKAALDQLRQETQDNYVLSYLSNDGFFPGHALSRERCIARSLDPYQELSRPAAVALRELTPANWTYADEQVFQVHRVDFHALLPGESEGARALAQRDLVVDEATGGISDVATREVEGGTGAETVRSLRLGGVELRTDERIDDTRDARRYVGFDIRGTTLPQHAGGWQGSVQGYTCRYYQTCRVLLVNLGPTGAGGGGRPWGFPICPVCGSARNPFGSDADLERFQDDHRKHCQIPELNWSALHVEIDSDVLQVGPFDSKARAVNAMTGILLGSGQILDMGTAELDGFLLPEAADTARFVLYDPAPGGSGFLPQIARHRRLICEQAIAMLESCPGQCESACYSCLMHYRNQFHHRMLDRHQAAEVLGELVGDVAREHDIPPATDVRVESDAQPESDAESLLLEVLRQRKFPAPTEAQYTIHLGDGGETVADYAYPDERIVVYVDGMSESTHGGAMQQAKDKILRAKLRAKGWNVVEIAASALKDDSALAVHLSELAIHLGREDLLSSDDKT